MQYVNTTVESLVGTHTVMQYGDKIVEGLFAHTL